ncbi:MAG TPA: hypothetical protein VJM74_03765 [Nitrososphaeraceae archaeon]|nr:hypothetical protein [Nitrososphaeraceae archaeon]
MAIPEDTNSTSIRSAAKWLKFLMIMIILVGGLSLGLWYFFLSSSHTAIKNNGAVLPSNCYSVNGKQTCVTPKS